MKTFSDKLAEAFAIGLLFYGAFILLYVIPTTLYDEYIRNKNNDEVTNCTSEPRYWDSPNVYTLNCKIKIK